jgi:hypothetical protein
MMVAGSPRALKPPIACTRMRTQMSLPRGIPIRRMGREFRHSVLSRELRHEVYSMIASAVDCSRKSLRGAKCSASVATR